MPEDPNSTPTPDSATEIEVKVQPNTDPTVEDKEPASEKRSLSQKLSQVGDRVQDVAKGTVSGVGKTLGNVGNTAMQAGAAAVHTATGLGSAIASTALNTGKAAVGTASTVGGAAGHQAQKILEKATEGAGQAANLLVDNPLLKFVTKVARADWLLGIVGQVDVVKAEAAVRKLQEKYPTETSFQIAHRIMVEKALYAGGIGLASNFIPTAAATLFAVDLAATTLLQAEMVYQIAAAYGLDLKDSTRKGEVLAIFGLSLGGSKALKAGLGLIEIVPVAGAAVGASTNAAMLYSLGHAACRFYEAKTNPQVPQDPEAVEQESEAYLQVAIAQQALMDQILAHMIIASYPEKAWSDIVPELTQLNFTPESLEAIASHIKQPQPIDTLIAKLDRDYAIPLLARCSTLAKRNNTVTPEEQKILDTLSQKFNLNLQEISDSVTG